MTTQWHHSPWRDLYPPENNSKVHNWKCVSFKCIRKYVHCYVPAVTAQLIPLMSRRMVAAATGDGDAEDSSICSGMLHCVRIELQVLIKHSHKYRQLIILWLTKILYITYFHTYNKLSNMHYSINNFIQKSYYVY